jgi:hypothetical protein
VLLLVLPLVVHCCMYIRVCAVALYDICLYQYCTGSTFSVHVCALLIQKLTAAQFAKGSVAVDRESYFSSGIVYDALCSMTGPSCVLQFSYISAAVHWQLY